MAAAVVADASVLIALGQIGRLALLEQLFGDIVVPSTVAREVAPGLPQLPHWILTRQPRASPDRRIALSNLDAGERDAIALAHETSATLLILDDLPARRVATTMGLTVIGTAGVLYLAKQRGLVPAVRPLLDALLARGFRLRQDVYDEILRAAGEAEATP